MPMLVQAHAVATLLMVGIIWYVQVVHYPLMALADRDRFPAFAAAHARRTAWIVGPPMILEGATAVLLAWRPPEGCPAAAAPLGLLLLLVVWLSTASLQVPCHRRLAEGFDAAVHRRLVAGNRLRTAAWSLRGVVAVWLLAACG